MNVLLSLEMLGMDSDILDIALIAIAGYLLVIGA